MTSPPRPRRRRWRARALAAGLGVFLALAVGEVAARVLGLGYLNLPTVPHPTRHHWHAPGDRWMVWGPHGEYGGFEACCNSEGFAMSAELPPATTPSLVVLGDSFVEGLQVPEAQRFVTLLGSRLGIPALDLGCASYCPLLERLLLEEVQGRVAPKAVVLLLYSNDIGDEAALHDLVVRDATGRAVSVRGDGRSPVVRLARASHLARFAWKTWLAWRLERDMARRTQGEWEARLWAPYFPRPLEQTFTPAELAQVEGSVGEVRDLCRAHGWPFLLSAVPDRGALKQGAPDPFADHWAAWSAAQGVTFLDLRPAFRAHDPTTLFFPTDAHLTAAGHAVVAEAWAPALGAAIAGR